MNAVPQVLQAMSCRDQLESAVMAALRANTVWVRRRGRSASVTFVKRRHTGIAHLGCEWFVVDVPVRSIAGTLPSIGRIWALLNRNGRLRGAKFVMLPCGTKLALRAEFPLCDLGPDDVEEVNARMADACAAIATALELPGAASCRETESPPACETDTRLIDRLVETGWRSITVAGNRLRVELEVPNGFHQAIVERRPNAIRLHVDVLLGGCGSAPGPCRRALGILLLRAAGLVRMASSAAYCIDGELVPRFQVLLPAEARPALLSHALAALSVACAVCADEAEALHQDPGLAAAYLAMQTAGDSA